MIRKLITWSNDQMRLNLSERDIELMISDQQTIKIDTLAINYLKSEIKRLALVFYGREFDQEVQKLFLEEIRKKFQTLSCTEVKHVFEKIIDGKTDIKSKFFNISDVTKLLFQFKVSKEKIRDKFFQLTSSDKETELELQKYSIFLNVTIEKYKNSELLNIYEKSALGGYYESEISNANELLDFAKKNFSQKEKELEKIQKAREQSENTNSFGAFLTLEETKDEPIFWTERLLYRFYLFQEFDTKIKRINK